MTNDTREALADELDGIASLLGRNQLMQRGTASRKIRQAAAALRTPVSAASSPSAEAGTKEVDWDDVRGMAPDATGELSSEAFVRQMRDGWDKSDTPSVAGTERPVVSLLPMRLSDGRCDYFVLIKVGDREVTPHVFREKYKADYHIALYDWLLNGGREEPDVMDFNDDPKGEGFGADDHPAQIRRTVAETDEALIERMARAAWERTHDGQFDDRNCCDEFVRQSYIEDMRAALAASPAAPSPAVERENKLHDLLNDAEKHVSELIDQLRSAEGALKAARAKISDERPTISNANVWQSWREMNASLIAIREILDAALTAQPATAGEP